MTVVKGGGTANSLVSQFESKWGRTLMGKTLIRNIAQSLYRDSKSLEKNMRNNVRPPLQPLSSSIWQKSVSLPWQAITKHPV